MKFDCGPSAQTKAERIKEWHDWFAWYPVRIDEHDCRWLETVERRNATCLMYVDPEWEYRPKDSGVENE